ncbi:HPR(SER) KINASE/PHOSPHATASE [Mycoplasmopsis pulmonis]|uniref:HPr kinase/phosphorylase n=1 Tax=Mycoplasmopsis pulmonis (strain UAB CTIP) TaxID=272635 RepID=HPRK_MYCPU|nr:HPr(Ser) kinase/phosphatase [Mycoplasmopsis pulmonis]Q98PL1.1 RecName: Full=HPr kinase/phosphorylase; Short=HPrK/P; AltName: Full=HPr(Ser) kinase/phosphorylase [Mycoplasmopsis pulmonis UAB CTIP]MDZ7293436.1 HPr(Ser) kinase/phosphatase [Mycoplasmopsis pulmonis]CAC13884.1 HPR(SER) KINASE/PHOSPHATASE [Mycoplasmopsis pulmonis]VEU68477.1 HPr kinase/phosphorylase [Mycoplasmopsis pulmonis]
MKKKLFVSELIKHFDLEVLNHDFPEIEDREILTPSIKRLGLELSGHFIYDAISGVIVGWGTNESKFFEKIGSEKAKSSIEEIFSRKIPMLVLSKGFDKNYYSTIIEIANKHKTPVIFYKASLSEINTILGIYLLQYFAKKVQVHGTLVSVFGMGILIVGDSGLGKSEAALELVQKGHVLISDDAVLVSHYGNKYFGKAPYITKNLIEVRGLGLIDILSVHGLKSVLPECEINFVVELKDYEQNKSNFDRLGNKVLKYQIGEWKIPKIEIPIRQGRSVASLIEASANMFLSKLNGHDVLAMIQERSLNDE